MYRPLVNSIFSLALCGWTVAMASPLATAMEPATGQADDPAQTEKKPAETLRILDTFSLTVPADWQRQRAASSIVEHEFKIPNPQGGDAPAGRVTLMAASGDVAANISRWEEQFGKKNPPKIDKQTVGEQTVHMVQLSGTFKDSMGGGPFAGGKTVMRENYGMLGAIIELKNGAKYFVKVTGPNDLIEANVKAFKEMLAGIKN